MQPQAGGVRQETFRNRNYVGGPGVTDAGIERLAGLTRLQVLAVRGITDQGVASLKGLSDLRLLSLSGTKITDGGIAHLAALKNLEFLDVSGTHVTDKALEQLWEQIPELVIVNAKGSLPARQGQKLGRMKGM
jgi:Leucine-rich repeat (LRR) protein